MEKELGAVFKVVMAGESGVGKTQLIQRFAKGVFSVESMNTVGIELMQKVVTVGEYNVRVQLWDTGGQEKFRCINAPYFRGASGVVLVYDITSSKSLEAVSYWLDEVRQKATADVALFLVGNKADLSEQRQVRESEGQAFAAQAGVPWLETSAKTGVRVSEAFESLIQRICRSPAAPTTSLKIHKSQSSASRKHKRSWC
jgi:small GTP-binding protein